jgi:major membrane immunogen (membrane-anchored lipoprotein)
MRRIFVTIAACAALALAACGGDDETTIAAPTTTGPTGATGATGAEGAAGSGSAVEEAITDAGFGIESVQCPDEVPLEGQGDEFNCDFEQEGESGTMTVTVDSADEQSATISYQGSAGSIDVEGSGVAVKK